MTQEIGFECVMPHEPHARLVMSWRNDPETLKQSFHTKPKEWGTFYTEFRDRYFTIPELPPLFALWQGDRVAFLRFRFVGHPEGKNRRCCEISINVAPEFRHKGLGEAILLAAKEWVRLRGYDDILAEIKKDNAASHKVFVKAGYERLGETQKVLEDISEPIPIFRYIARLTPGNKESSTHVFIIAEAGSNWRMGTPARDRAMSRALIDVAANAGADAVKFQVYRPETVYVKNAGTANYLADRGVKEEICSIFEDLSMLYEMVAELAAYCKTKKIQFMATAFSPADFAAVDPHVSVHKLASYEISHLRLIELAARAGKPLIMSTGAAEESEISWAVETFYANGGKDLTLLQCTAKYPADPSSMNLRVIPWLKQHFGVQVGLSDHSRDPIHAPVAAVALGATVIEKHYTLDNRLPGPDHFSAITAHELEQMVVAIRATEKMLGTGIKEVLPAEMELRKYARRGIQAVRPILRGEMIREGYNVDILRPGQQSAGIHPKFLAQIEGKVAKRDIPEGAGIQQGDVAEG